MLLGGLWTISSACEGPGNGVSEYAGREAVRYTQVAPGPPRELGRVSSNDVDVVLGGADNEGDSFRMGDHSGGSESRELKNEVRSGVFECSVGACSRKQERYVGRGHRYCLRANDVVRPQPYRLRHGVERTTYEGTDGGETSE